MATAFNEQEREVIRAALLDAARRCAATTGLKKTTLDVLTQQAGISKSAFYVFFPSKEHLFLHVHALWHQEIFAQALHALEESPFTSARERAAYILESTCRALGQSDMFKNALEDWPLLERKLPRDDIESLAQSDALLIRQLIAQANITLSISLEEASAVVRILIMSLRFRTAIGASFDAALSRLVRAVCTQCIAA